MIEFGLIILMFVAYAAMTVSGDDELMVSAARSAGGDRDPAFPAGFTEIALLLMFLFGGLAVLVSMVGGGS